MQKVIIVCLLALSMCLCSPIEEKGNPKASPATNTVPKQAEPAPPQHDAAKLTPTEHAVTQNSTENAQKQNSTNPATVANVVNPTQTTTATTLKEPKEAAIPKPDHSKTTENATTANATAITEKAPSSTPKAAVSTPKAAESTTTKASTTVKPAADDAHTVQTRKFDGPSFIGGIIMTVGLLAISFMGYKYYKNQTERNYHTL